MAFTQAGKRSACRPLIRAEQVDGRPGHGQLLPAPERVHRESMRASVDRKSLGQLWNRYKGKGTEAPHVQGAGWTWGFPMPCAVLGAQSPSLLMVSSTVQLV